MRAKTLWTIALLLSCTGLCTGIAAADAAPEPGAEPALATPRSACAAPLVLPALTPAGPGEPQLAAAGGTVDTSGLTPCCYSDYCPGWGSYKVSCCAEGCSAWSDRVWCSHTGFIYCPNPCASNGICHSPCGSSDPDCGGGCQCTPSGACTGDDDCCGYTCDKEPWEIVGECAC